MLLEMRYVYQRFTIGFIYLQNIFFSSFVLFTLGNRIFYFERIKSDDRMLSISPASVDVFSYQWVSYPLLDQQHLNSP